MTELKSTVAPYDGKSVCLFCGSSDGKHPDYLAAGQEFGRKVAEAGWRLVYGGGGVGLMGGAARQAYANGGRVVGIMPGFLRSRERLFDEVETVVVESMHQRKQMMYDESDVFVVAPGGIGTLEEVVELLSWKRLDLHAKPVIFLNINGFWDSFYKLIEDTVNAGMTPESFLSAYVNADSVDEAIRLMLQSEDTPHIRHDGR
ncbi:TIGR00730 family Rossman fold protein [uncultured Brevundimonas sp.]|uniref:LOG family protein n=1 Tax=uncultured Brevundimonas sp. TaxID=213418 RepID=UPI002615B929|nr:TIGR00730 family Rossman fold protein [uncultured Brevundimonas sp.]